MNQIHQFPSLFCHKPLNKVHIVQIPSGGNPECGVIVTVVHNILRRQPVAVLLFKLFQSLYGYGCTVAKPVYEFFPGLVIEYQGKVIEKGGKPNHIGSGIVFQPLYQVFPGKPAGCGLAHVKGNLVGLVPPVIGDMVVHLGRVPDCINQERYRIFMESQDMIYFYHMPFLVHFPVFNIHFLSFCPVHNLPPFFTVMNIIGNYLLAKIPFHERNLHLLSLRRNPPAH